MKRILALILSILVLVSPSLADEPTSGGAWPAWRGGHYGGAYPAPDSFESASGLQVSWRSPVGSGYSAIVVAGGQVVTLASDHAHDHVVALDEESGKELWRVRLAETYPGRDGAVDGPVSTPAIDGDAVFALGPFGHLVSLDLETGKKRWETHLVDDHSATVPHWGFTTSPLVHDDLLVVAAGGSDENMVLALNRSTGEVVWKSGDDVVNYQSPIVMRVDGRDQIVCAGDRRIYGFRPRDGATLWETRHRGQDFYAKIINPVVAREGELFMTYRGFEATLLSLEGGEDGYQVTPVWKSRHLARNYNVAAYHEGHLYGYSRDFLVCVDATSGDLVWKSRPPGNGFLVAVGGHLVILTKKGLLSVVRATPESYQEVTRKQVFERRCWTPPSFAGGHIYVRCEVDDVARVAIVKDGSRLAVRSHASLTVPDSEFARLIEAASRSDAGKQELDRFLEKQDRFPIIEGEDVVHIVYRGNAKNVAIQGDFFEIGVQEPLLHLPGTDLFHASFRVDPRAILNYQLIEDFGDPGPDPRNLGEENAIGAISLIRMPRHEGSPYLEEDGDAPSGRLESVPFKVPSEVVGGLTWQGSRTLQVYLPPGYSDEGARYPVLYVHDGSAALRQGHMKTILDNTVGKTVAPLIAVFVPMASAYEYARSQREVYARALVEGIVPLIDRRYRTIAKPSSRAILGGDEGGFGALFVSLVYPGVFGKVAAQSAMPIGEGEELLLTLIEKMSGVHPVFYIDWGTCDQRMTATGTDVARTGQLLTKRLRAAGCKVWGGQTPNGAGFASWRTRTHEILETFFPVD